ncbi:DUF1850 domain-containing protein [Hydrogenophilus thiooxidans]|uniref:DUF1850 domain-containing protein n=1 Tax=Hydrogenophilus thiooxidans TaxID=2820326 RepID=UPI001C23FD40|nr:DUF1850 domain-containing protein [Hydrogenophilus thiooxidans]
MAWLLCLSWAAFGASGARDASPHAPSAPILEVLGAAGTLRWRHSIEKSWWEEAYTAEPGGVRLLAARVRGSGAGMEPPPEAHFEHGVWVYRPNRLLPKVVLTHSSFAAPYEWCGEGSGCRALLPPASRLDAEQAPMTSVSAWRMEIAPCRGEQKST